MARDGLRRYVGLSPFTRVVLAVLLVKGLITFGPVTALVFVATISGALVLMNARTLPLRLHFRWPIYSVIIGLGAGALTPYFTGRSGGDAFYSAVTQIIPVLMLTIAVELRPRPKWPLSGEIGLAASVMFVLVAGECYALNALDRGHVTSTELGVVVGALVTGFAAVILVALSQPPVPVDLLPQSAGSKPRPDAEVQADWRTPDGYR